VPSGHRIELYADMALSEAGPMTTNPELWRDEPHGMRVTRFDHCNLHGPNIDAVVKFFTEVLDFSLTEAAQTPDGSIAAAFLSCSNKAHDIAFIRRAEPRLHVNAGREAQHVLQVRLSGSANICGLDQGNRTWYLSDSLSCLREISGLFRDRDQAVVRAEIEAVAFRASGDEAMQFGGHCATRPGLLAGQTDPERAQLANLFNCTIRMDPTPGSACGPACSRPTSSTTAT